jgi:hypothetical protein
MIVTALVIGALNKTLLHKVATFCRGCFGQKLLVTDNQNRHLSPPSEELSLRTRDDNGSEMTKVVSTSLRQDRVMIIKERKVTGEQPQARNELPCDYGMRSAGHN